MSVAATADVAAAAEGRGRVPMVILYLIMPGLPEDDDAIRGCVRGWNRDTAATEAREAPVYSSSLVARGCPTQVGPTGGRLTWRSLVRCACVKHISWTDPRASQGGLTTVLGHNAPLSKTVPW